MKTDLLNGIAARRDRAFTLELFKLMLKEMCPCEDEGLHDYPSMRPHGYRDHAIISVCNEIPDIHDGTHLNASSTEKSTKESG
jgi:hypothetical protein